jgi:hypothetical protein
MGDLSTVGLCFSWDLSFERIRMSGVDLLR